MKFNPDCELDDKDSHCSSAVYALEHMFGVTKPSDIVSAMLDGLEEQTQREDFEIDMDTYGRWWAGLCYGCAATCALTKLSGLPLDPVLDAVSGIFEAGKSRMRRAVGDTSRAWYAVESFYNALRQDPLWALLDRELITAQQADELRAQDLVAGCLRMTDNTWREQLPNWRRLVSTLQEAGL